MFQIDRKKLKYFDYPLFFSVLLISSMSVFTIYTIQNGRIFALRQLFWVLAGVALSIVVANVDIRKIKSFAKPFYLFSLLLLILVFLNGVLSHGAKRWISIAFFHIQPSEFVKVSIILVLAHYFDENPKYGAYSFNELFIPFILIVIPTGLILIQPDLGTSVIILAISFSILLLAGIKRSLLMKMAILGITFLPFAWSSLKPYQKDRIMAFINPYAAPATYGYHIIQSEIAIGSGGLLGKGVKGATQTALNFLPESHTDFIFSVFSEQRGFVGDLILIFLYLFIILRAIRIAKNTKSNFERFVAIGIIAMIWVSFVFNVGMTMGLLPVVGIPLVFFSYGGSAMIINFFCLGLLLSIKLRNSL